MTDYWSKTGELFSKIIEKPKMAEKFLKKPPPKYIYDIVMNTMKATGFPKGLFTEEETNVKYFEADPRNKIEILQKVIDITKIVTNENFEIKCTSILKGEEPEKTNHFLQQFAKAATNGKDNSKFIEKYLDHKKKKAEDKKKKEEAASKKQDKPAEPPKKETVVQPQQAPKPQPSQTSQKGKVMDQAKPQQNKATPKGIISEKGDDNFDANIGKNDLGGKDEKIKSGTGVKLGGHIFIHNDLMNEGKKDTSKPKVSNVDLETIKAHVQEITKTINPIGKIIEFIGEDVDSMNKELQNWIKESKSYKDRYDEEIKKSDETLLPLQNELLELEDSIRDEQMQIKSIKSRLIKNEDIIKKLITNVISFKGEN